MRDRLDIPDPPPRRKKYRDMPWSPKPLVLVRRLVLQEYLNDFVIRRTVATSLSSTDAEVGGCLSMLVEDGILLPLRPISETDRDGDPVSVTYGNLFLEWVDGGWKSHVSTRSSRSRRTGRLRTGLVRTGTVTDWDGRGYYMVRDSSEFKKACRSESLPDDPRTGSVVVQGMRCSQRAPEQQDVVREVLRAEVSEAGGSVGPSAPSCPRCGSPLAHGSLNGKRRIDHSLRKCNMALVRHVLEI